MSETGRDNPQVWPCPSDRLRSASYCLQARARMGLVPAQATGSWRSRRAGATPATLRFIEPIRPQPLRPRKCRAARSSIVNQAPDALTRLENLATGGGKGTAEGGAAGRRVTSSIWPELLTPARGRVPELTLLHRSVLCAADSAVDSESCKRRVFAAAHPLIAEFDPSRSTESSDSMA
jgi:hypothetical protein